MYPEWQDQAIIGGLTSSGLVIVEVNGQEAKELERIPFSARIRDVELSPDGSVIALTDSDDGMVLRLTKMENLKKFQNEKKICRNKSGRSSIICVLKIV